MYKQMQTCYRCYKPYMYLFKSCLLIVQTAYPFTLWTKVNEINSNVKLPENINICLKK